MSSSILGEEIKGLESIFGISSGADCDSTLPSPGILFDKEQGTLRFYSEYKDGILEIKISVPFCYPHEESAYILSSWYFDFHYLTSQNESSPSKNLTLAPKTFKKLKEIIEKGSERKDLILFELVKTLENSFDDVDLGEKNFQENEVTENDHEKSRNNVKLGDNFDGDKIFGITHGEPIVDRKSVFQAHVCKVFTTEDVEKVIKWLLSNTKIARATHNMWAYRLCKDKKPSSGGSFPIGYDIISLDHDSDGETAAGSRLQHLLNIIDAKNIFVMVTRWYGGIQLGPDRFRHINNAARQTLEKAGLINDNSQKPHVFKNKKVKEKSK
ncbi:ximpact-like protein [Cryptosporidium xiaoi]|uniref:Ximpact-like protein n=1 Tax=Cryptosporidium xiaoi TaxID=659607 RepID=A0AAV9Y1Y8_9CRYT